MTTTKPTTIPFSPTSATERVAVATIFFVNGMSLGSWVTRIPTVQARLALSTGTVGLALLAMAVGALVAMVCSGWLSERFGAVRLVRASMVLMVLALPIPGAATSLLMLMAGLFLFGMGNGAMDVAMNAEAVRVEQRVGRPIMSSFHGLWSSGSMTGAALGSVMVARGINPAVHLAGIAILIGIVGTVALRYIGAGSVDKVEPTAEKVPIFVIPPRSLLGLAAIILCAYVSEGAIGDWNALFLIREEHVSKGLAAAVFSAFSMAMAIGRFGGDAVIHRFGPVATLRAGSIMAAIALSVELLVGQPWIAFPAMIVLGLSFAAIVPIGFSAAGNTPGISAGRALAAVATAGYGGFLAGPPVIGFVAEAIHLRGALGLIVVLCFTMTFFANSVKPRDPRA